MQTVYTDKHKLRDAKTELFGGELVPPFECPARAEYVLQRVNEVALGELARMARDGDFPLYLVNSPLPADIFDNDAFRDYYAGE